MHASRQKNEMANRIVNVYATQSVSHSRDESWLHYYNIADGVTDDIRRCTRPRPPPQSRASARTPMHALCASSHSYSASLTVRAMQNSEAALASLLLQVEGIHGGGDRRESGSKQPCDSIATTLPLSSLAYANIVRLSLDMPSRRRRSWLADEPHTTRRGRAARPAARVRSSHSPLTDRMTVPKPLL